MTENETIKGLMFLKEKLYNGIYADRLDCIDYAISALKEIQQYREIGSVGEIKQAIGVLSLSENDIIKTFHELNEYHKIGTVEECRKAVEKQKPEKPEIYTDTIQTISSSFNRDVYLCSRCGQFIGNIDDELPRYCNCCGQRIDEDLEGMEDENT